MTGRQAGDRVAALLCLLPALVLGYLARDFPAGGHQFPLFAAAAVGLLSASALAASFFRTGAPAAQIPSRVLSAGVRPLALTLAVVVYVLLMFRLGYFVASVLFVLVTVPLVGFRNYRVIAVACAILFPLMYLFFELLLRTGLPRGIFL